MPKAIDLELLQLLENKLGSYKVGFAIFYLLIFILQNFLQLFLKFRQIFFYNFPNNTIVNCKVAMYHSVRI